MTKKEIAMTKLTADNYPGIWAAASLLCEDQGINIHKIGLSVEMCTTDCDGHSYDAGDFDQFLHALSKEDLTTFCVGEQDDRIALIERLDHPYAETANRLVEAIFIITGC